MNYFHISDIIIYITMSTKQIFEEDSKIRCLKIKMISKHGDKFIVGDSSSLSILHAPNMSYQNGEVEKFYIIQKPLNKMITALYRTKRPNRLTSLLLMYQIRSRNIRSWNLFWPLWQMLQMWKKTATLL